jgi:hypothetical protein
MTSLAARALGLTILAAGCAGGPRGGEPAPSAVALPREASRAPDGGPGYEVPLAGWTAERNRCIDRELEVRELNEYGDARGTVYPDGKPLEVAMGTDRHAYVMRRHPGIASACSRAPGEGRP